jgi:NADH-quinone oxidoreductase subunit H
VKRAPFDLPEAESELVAGFHTEYSGFRWSLFFFGEYAAMFVVSGLLVILFLGAWHSPFSGLAPDSILYNESWSAQLIRGLLFSGPIWFILKCALLIYVQMWLRWTLPRLRIDQVLYSCVQVILPLTMAVLLASVFWELWMHGESDAAKFVGAVTRLGLGLLGVAGTIAILTVMTSAFRLRRVLVGPQAVERPLPGG